MADAKTEAKNLIERGEYSLACVKGNEIIFKDGRNGIAPLIDLNDFSPEILEGAFLFDKIIGKAAAMIAINCKCSYVYGSVMGKEAERYLKANNIPFSFNEEADFILNRTGTGMCPIEDSVKDIEDIKEGCKAIRKRADFLKSKANNK